MEACCNKVFEVAASVHDSTAAENLDLPTLSFYYYNYIRTLKSELQPSNNRTATTPKISN